MIRVGWDSKVSRLHAALERIGPSWTVAETSRGDNVTFDAELSRTQRRVLTALCRPVHAGGSYAAAATNQKIAQELFLSMAAVKTQLRRRGSPSSRSVTLPQNRKRAALAEAALRSGAVARDDLGSR